MKTFVHTSFDGRSVRQALNPNSAVAAAMPPGSTSDSPVPGGDSPLGMRGAPGLSRRPLPFQRFPVPSGQWPDGTGESAVPPVPTLEFGIKGRRLVQRAMLALAASLGFFNSVGHAAVQVGVPAPAWALADVNGQMVRSADFTGKVVVLNFLLTYCTPSRIEAPTLVALQEQYRAEGLAVVGVPVYQDPSELMPYLVEHGVNFTMCPVTASNPIDAILWDYSVLPAALVPVTAIIDRNNVLVEWHLGYLTKEHYEQILRPLLSASKPQPRSRYQRIANAPALKRTPDGLRRPAIQ